MADSTREVIWKDRKHFLWFPWSFTKYYIEVDRLMIETGLFQTTLDETLLYRIVDIKMHQSLAGKIFNTGDIVVTAKVDSSPEIVLENVLNPKKVRTMLSQLVEESRQKRNVVGKEFYGSGSHMHMDFDGDGICDAEESFSDEEH
ncbi:MAG: PH domain-containing protein [Lachnospiraceae bacterium]|nr:PH domain-containing protein [Lachnospiraceae bacterium]